MSVATHRSPTVPPFDKTRPVAVLAGGSSAEREISLKSGRAVASALTSAGLNVRLVDVREEPIALLSFRDREVAFIALHGTYGEDGGCQRDLEQRGVAYTGCGASASALAFDKSQARRVAREADLHTADGCVWRRGDDIPSLGYPLVVKPVAQGSSVGLTYVEREDGLGEALQLAAASGDALVERFVSGEEWTVAIFRGRAFPPVRVEYAGRLFDHDAKYQSASSNFWALTDASDERCGLLTHAAEIAWRAFDARGLVRVDFILEERAGLSVRPVFLEMNTIPGLTERSLAPIAAAAAGVSFQSLCLQMLSDTVELSGEACGP